MGHPDERGIPAARAGGRPCGGHRRAGGLPPDRGVQGVHRRLPHHGAVSENGARILVVEDEPSLAESISYNLVREGYSVATAADGEGALSRFRADPPQLVLLDLMLPKLSGLDVLRSIRSESNVPVVILTAKDAEADKVAGLELGADDYVTKPFSMRELVSRVRAHLRRADMSIAQATSPPGKLAGGPVEMDPDRHEVLVRGADYVGDTKTLDVHVKRLRQKIEEDRHRPRNLLTVRGLGYKFID